LKHEGSPLISLVINQARLLSFMVANSGSFCWKEKVDRWG